MSDSLKKYQVHFTQVSNAVLYDNRLSLKAKGIYAYLFSKPDGWEFHLDVMHKEVKEGREAIYTAIRELEYYGYITKHQKNENGKFGGTVYEFVEPYTENPYTENTAAVKTVYGNNISNTDNLNNINLNTPHYIPPEGKIEHTEKGSEILFEEFWNKYIPVRCNGMVVGKGSKKESCKKFFRLVSQGTSYQDIITGLEAYLSYCQKNKQLTCSVPVFLNQERWKDDYGEILTEEDRKWLELKKRVENYGEKQ